MELLLRCARGQAESRWAVRQKEERGARSGPASACARARCEEEVVLGLVAATRPAKKEQLRVGLAREEEDGPAKGKKS
jgi:hypothetical protein